MISVLDEHYLLVGDQKWWGQFNQREGLIDGHQTWLDRQFVVYFENKWKVSVIWGDGAYGDNHGRVWREDAPEFNETPERVEAAILHADRCGVIGDTFNYLDAEQLNTLLTYVSTLATDEEIPPEWEPV